MSNQDDTKARATEPLELTPLGAARTAIESARHEIEDALEAAEDRDDSLSTCTDVELKVDTDSFGFAAILDYGDKAAPDADWVLPVLLPICQRYGIGTIYTRADQVDAISVPEPAKVQPPASSPVSSPGTAGATQGSAVPEQAATSVTREAPAPAPDVAVAAPQAEVPACKEGCGTTGLTSVHAWWSGGRPLGYCTPACHKAGRPLNPVPEVQPVPAGYRLGDGWTAGGQRHREGHPSMCDHLCGAPGAYVRRSNTGIVASACREHAISLGALVPIEPTAAPEGQQAPVPAEAPEKGSPGVGMPASLYLQEFGDVVRAAFDAIPYQVGSSLPGSGKASWRDVDVRLILDDERYAAEGYGDPDRSHDSAKWRAMAKAFSLLGRQMTGLPIDFQVQQLTHANREFGTDEPRHYRSALFSPGKVSK